MRILDLQHGQRRKEKAETMAKRISVAISLLLLGFTLYVVIKIAH